MKVALLSLLTTIALLVAHFIGYCKGVKTVSPEEVFQMKKEEKREG